MYAGGSGENLTTQVKFIVLPLSMNSSGSPIMSVVASAKKRTQHVVVIKKKKN